MEIKVYPIPSDHGLPGKISDIRSANNDLLLGPGLRFEGGMAGELQKPFWETMIF